MVAPGSDFNALDKVLHDRMRTESERLKGCKTDHEKLGVAAGAPLSEIQTALERHAKNLEPSQYGRLSAGTRDLASGILEELRTAAARLGVSAPQPPKLEVVRRPDSKPEVAASPRPTDAAPPVRPPSAPTLTAPAVQTQARYNPGPVSPVSPAQFWPGPGPFAIPTPGFSPDAHAWRMRAEAAERQLAEAQYHRHHLMQHMHELARRAELAEARSYQLQIRLAEVEARLGGR